MLRNVRLFFTLLFATAVSVLAGPIDDIVSQVSLASYTSTLDNSLYTHYGDNRGFGAQHDLAQANIVSAFQSFGLNTVLEPFLHISTTYYNVVATLPGVGNPSQIYVVGAHYDSTGFAGADDNASGTAAVIEAARVLSQHQFQSTIIFIAFDREEQGLIGSLNYTNAHAGDNVQGMVDLDMIAYNPAGADQNKVWVAYNVDNSPLTQELRDSIEAYDTVNGGPNLTTFLGVSGGSDHVPFDGHNYNAAMVIEYGMIAPGTGNPNYHQFADSVDTPGYIDYAFATAITRGVVGYLATEAQLTSSLEIPEPASMLLLGASALLVVRRKRRIAA